MEFRYTRELESFREEVRAFFREEMAPERTREHADPLDLTGYDEGFERALLLRAGARGFLGVTLPLEYGGGDRPLAYKAIFDFEAAFASAPAIDTPVTLIAPPLLAFGTEQQKQHYLPRIARGEALACIAYSEPDAGSDLSRIATVAREDGDGFVLDGHKCLVTAAHKADWCCLVARSDADAPARRAMSMFLVEMSAPGIRVSRRATANGWTLGEIHFESARVPLGSLLGKRGRGFAQMAAALQAERSGMFYLGWATRSFEALVDACRDGDSALPRDLLRSRLAQLRCELEVAERFAKRVVWRQARGELPVHEAAMAKLYATELLQRLAQARLEMLGSGASRSAGFAPAAFAERFAYELLERVHATIGAGTSEIQRNAIAQSGLGLPRA